MAYGSAAIDMRDVSAEDSIEDRVRRLNAEVETAGPLEILEFAIKSEFAGRLALVSSFGAEAAVLLHMTAQVDPSTPVVFLETGKHFAQTLQYRNELQQRLGLTDVRSIAPDAGELAAEDPDGDLWRRDTDACCGLRKVRPLDRALAEFDAWITGRKQFHGGQRARLPVFEASAPHIKVNPLARQSKNEIDAYFAAHDLPHHPLVAQGFPSIGCWPCTRPVGEGGDLRAGRWAGADKTECGIHARRA